MYDKFLRINCYKEMCSLISVCNRGLLLFKPNQNFYRAADDKFDYNFLKPT